MTTLTTWLETGLVPESMTEDLEILADRLAASGIRFARWEASHPLGPDDDQDAILAAYGDEIARLKQEGGYAAADVIRLKPGTPDIEPMRAKFLSEHTHDEDEVRFFVEGSGAFYLRIDGRVHQVICRAGDLIGVPALTRHWFDMGPNPHFTAIRLFTNPEGWVARYTGDPIADRFPRYETLDA